MTEAIDKKISQFIERQFPEIYRREGPLFVGFVKKYYEWLEGSNNVIYHSRRLLDYVDIDKTVDDFVIHFKEKYLSSIQADTVVATRRLVKHSLDLYRSKGTERSVDLFFRAVFGKPASVYYPGKDIWRLSDGHWVKPKYLEVTPTNMNYDMIGQQIIGAISGATAFVERYIRRRIKGKYVNVLYISAINGSFQTNEVITIDGVPATPDNPIVVGSMTNLEVFSGGFNFRVGDIVDLDGDNGSQGKGRITAIDTLSGAVEFTLEDGGWGYTQNAQVIISDKVLSLANVEVDSNNYSLNVFQIFEKVVQAKANLTYTDANGSFSAGDELFTYYSNGDVAGYGVIIDVTATNSTAGEIYVSNRTGEIAVVSNPNANLDGNVFLVEGSKDVYGVTPGTNATGTVVALPLLTELEGTGTKLDKEFFRVAANGSGTVSINSTSSNVTGTTTSFLDEFSEGDWITFFSNSTNWESRQVNSVANATHITLTVPPSFANATAAYAKSYIDEWVVVYSNSTYYQVRAINTVINSTSMTIASPITFSNLVAKVANVSVSGTKFILPNANQTGNVAVVLGNTGISGNGTTFTTSFGGGGLIALWKNTTVYEIKTIENVVNNTLLYLTNAASFSNATTKAGNTQVNPDTGFGDRLAFWKNATSFESHYINTVSNDSHISLQTTIGFSNTAAKYANVNAGFSFFTTGNAVTANISGWADKTATGNLIGYSSDATLLVSNTTTAYVNGQVVYQVNSLGYEIANAYIDSTILAGGLSTLTVSNVQGVFHTGTIVKSKTIAGVNTTSNGTMTSMSIRVGIESLNSVFDTAAYNELRGSVLGTRAEITAVGSGTLADFDVSNTISFPETVSIGLDKLADFVDVPLSADNYGFNILPTANINTIIADSLSFSNLTIGTVSALVRINPGSDYSSPPFAVIYEPFIAEFDKGDIRLEISNTSGIFTVGEEISQNVGGSGIVKEANSTVVVIKRITFADTFNTSNAVVGLSSNVTANVTGIFNLSNSMPSGLNAVVLTEVQNKPNTAVSIDVFDSGFGYLQGDFVSFTSSDGEGTGLAKVSLGRSGESEGYFKNKNGFLSSDKRFFDAEYYQEYSYEIQTSVVLDKYEKMLKDILHVAGMKMFSAVVIESTANAAISANAATVTTGIPAGPEWTLEGSVLDLDFLNDRGWSVDEEI